MSPALFHPLITVTHANLIQRSVAVWAGLVVLSAIAGCSSEPQFRMNSVHLLTLEKSMLNGGKVSDDHKRQIGDVLTAMFGTPNDPWFPDFVPDDDPLSQVVDLQNLRLSAGPVSSERGGEPRGLYREHCAHCHGISGNGAGPTASFLNPYPRDFRLGKFKFKSTQLLRAPTDEDLSRIIRDGIPGTAMPSFRRLTDQEIASLVDYVKYLSIRGQVERSLMEEIVQLSDEPLIDPGSDGYEDQLAVILEDIFLDIVERWSDAEGDVTEVPELPADFVSNQQAFADAGHQLFVGKANCVLCHGDTGYGDGQTENYDDWTNEWLKRANVDLTNAEEVGEFVRAGAFPPRKLRPRNLSIRVLRGGNRITDVYRRIANGIEGTSMPASTTLSEQEIWSLVAYVYQVPLGQWIDAPSELEIDSGDKESNR